MVKFRFGGVQLKCDLCGYIMDAADPDVLKVKAEEHAHEKHPSSPSSFAGLQKVALNVPALRPPPATPPPPPCDFTWFAQKASWHAKARMPGDHACVRPEGLGHDGLHKCACQATDDGAQNPEWSGARLVERGAR